MSSFHIAGAALALALTAAAHATVQSEIMCFEEVRAHQEEQQIFNAPIAGVENKYWFNYQVNLIEAKKELSRDLSHADDAKNLRNAWDEYRHELVHERATYVKAMVKRGYRVPIVTLVG